MDVHGEGGQNSFEATCKNIFITMQIFSGGEVHPGVRGGVPHGGAGERDGGGAVPRAAAVRGRGRARGHHRAARARHRNLARPLGDLPGDNLPPELL